MRDSWTGKEFFQKSFSQLKENNREPDIRKLGNVLVSFYFVPLKIIWLGLTEAEDR